MLASMYTEFTRGFLFFFTSQLSERSWCVFENRKFNDSMSCVQVEVGRGTREGIVYRSPSPNREASRSQCDGEEF